MNIKHAITLCLIFFSTAVFSAEEKAAETSVINPCEGMEEPFVLGADTCIDCHEDKATGMLTNPHGQMKDARTPFAADGCETCHGPGSNHIDVEGGCITSLHGRFGESVELRNDICLECHAGDIMHWTGSTHEAEDLACSSCHTVHKADKVQERSTQSDVCYECHKDIRAQTLRPSVHPIRDGKVICSDCHNSHGSIGPSALNKPGINETCFSCHAEKRGPFLWEHFPVTEDCTLCHKSHGSSHENLLIRQQPQLCQQCHQSIRGQGGGHIRQFLDYPGQNGRFILGEGCMNCHSKVHGSNHPSGVNLLR